MPDHCPECKGRGGAWHAEPGERIWRDCEKCQKPPLMTMELRDTTPPEIEAWQDEPCEVCGGDGTLPTLLIEKLDNRTTRSVAGEEPCPFCARPERDHA